MRRLVVSVMACSAALLTGCAPSDDQKTVRATCAAARPVTFGVASQLTATSSIHTAPDGQVRVEVGVTGSPNRRVYRSQMQVQIYDGDHVVAVAVPGVPGANGISDAVAHLFLFDARGHTTDRSTLTVESCGAGPVAVRGLTATVSYTLLSDNAATVGVLSLSGTVA